MVSSVLPSVRRTAAGVKLMTSACLVVTTATVNCASARVVSHVVCSWSTGPPSAPSVMSSVTTLSTLALVRYVHPVSYHRTPPRKSLPSEDLYREKSPLGRHLPCKSLPPEDFNTGQSLRWANYTFAPVITDSPLPL